MPVVGFLHAGSAAAIRTDRRAHIKNETPKKGRGDRSQEWRLHSPIPHTETSSYLRNRAVTRGFSATFICDALETDWLAGAAGLELANVAFRSLSYLFEISKRFCRN